MSDMETRLEAARGAERAGAWDEALAAYGELLSEARAAGADAQTANVLRWIGTLHRKRGDLLAAEEAFRDSLETAEAAALVREIASALNCLALVEHTRGQFALAEELYSRAADRARESSDERLFCMVEQNRAIVAGIRGDLRAALQRFGVVLNHLRAFGDDCAAAWVLYNMGRAQAELGDYPQAESCYDEAFRLAEQEGDLEHLATVEIGRAELYLELSDLDAARVCAERAFEIHGRIESKVGLADVYRVMGSLYRHMGKPRLAEAHLGTAVQLARECQDLLLEAESEKESARLNLDEGENEEALRSLNRTHALFTTLQAKHEIADIERRLDQLEDSYLEVVKAWGESIESKDRYTAGHCSRVADYTCMLAEAAGFSGRDLIWMRMGGFLHDVGKTAVPLEVLNKPGKLDPDEWELMKHHTVAGDDIVRCLGFPWDIRPIVRSHHERWDGSGYPDGLKGEEIPLTARILCIADVYDALTTTRSYRPAYSSEEALRIMREDRGGIFDPRLFDLFIELLEPEHVAPEAAGV